MRNHPVLLLLLLAAVCATAVAQSQQQSTSCTFNDGNGLRVTYSSVSTSKELVKGQVWSPDGQPMFLFAGAPIEIGGATLPVGAYSLYVIPGASDWTLIVNRNVTAGKPYDKAADVVRAAMQTGKLPSKANAFEAYFGHVAPQQCSLRLDYGATRAWVEMRESEVSHPAP